MRTSGVVTQVVARHEGATFGSDVFLDRRRRAARARAGDRRGHHHPRRAGVLRAAAAGRGGAARHRRGARPGAVLRPDGPQGAGRDGPRRRPDLPQPRVPRRHARRPRVDQRDLRRRDQDQLRALPALLDLPLGGARQAVGERQGARVQREGRGPAVPRPRQHAASTANLRADYAELGLPAGAVRLGGLLRPADPGRPDAAARTSPAAPAASPRSGGRSPSSAPASCCPTSSPTPRTSATSTRWSIHHGRGPPAAGGHRRSATARCRSRARSCAPTTTWSSSSPNGSTDEDARRDWAGPVTGTGTVNAFLRRLRSSLKPLRGIVRGDLPGHPGAAGDHRGPAGHGRRPAQPARARPALRGRRRARGRDGAQGGGGRRAGCCSR